MGLKAFSTLKARMAALVRSRAIKIMLFAGTPVIERIGLDRGDDGLVFTLFYNNGLMLSLGASGILDYQDSKFDGFVGAESRATRNREFLSMLHQIVLQSLLRYITAPRLDSRQREIAAEAASRLWLACEHRPGAYAASAKGASWMPGSPHESARLPRSP
jgi:hypothetical protein